MAPTTRNERTTTMFNVYYETAIIGRYETAAEAYLAHTIAICQGLDPDKLAYDSE